MKKKAGIALSIIGAVFIVIAITILFNSPAHQDTYINSSEDIVEATQEIKDEEETDTTTEYQEELEQETSQEQAASNTDSKLQSSTEQSVHTINPEVYEWPCGSKFFQDRKEPRQVTEFAEYKEYYEQIAQQFLEYEGKDVNFYGNYNKFYFDECSNEGSVKVSYDKELMLDLFEKSNITAIDVYSDRIIFHTDVSNGERIVYFYDETLTYDDPLPSEKDDLISHYWMVNIAPHWWWKDSSPGK